MGEIKVGEGLFGLRRAFQVAGDKNDIHEPVAGRVQNDTAVDGSLYREHFLDGKDTGESVRAASLQILRQRRVKQQSTHPFFWGSLHRRGGLALNGTVARDLQGRSQPMASGRLLEVRKLLIPYGICGDQESQSLRSFHGSNSVRIL